MHLGTLYGGAFSIERDAAWLGPVGPLTLEVVPPDSGPQERESNGFFASGGTSANVDKLNQYSPEIILRRRLALAVGRRLSKQPECIEEYVDSVIRALRYPALETNLALLKYAIPAEAVARVELADSGVREQTEIASREQWDSLAIEFSSHFTPTAGLALEESNPEAERGAP